MKATGLATAMTSGEIDIAYRQLTADQIAAFKTNTNRKVWEGVGAQIQYLCFQQQIAPYDNPLVRIAITAALNRSHVCDSVFKGTFEPLYSMIPAGMAYHKDSFKIWGDANYTYTRALLALYGYDENNKFPLTLYYESSGHYPQSQQQALVYQQDWEDSGVIDVTLEGLEWPSFRLARNDGTMPVFIYGWYPDFIDPDNYEFLPFASWLNLGFNSTHGGVAQYNLWVMGRSGTNDTVREMAYTALQDLQAMECSVVPLWQSNTVAVSKLNVKGITLDITVNFRLWLIYEE